MGKRKDKKRQAQMEMDLAVFDPDPPAQRHSATSVAAAESMRPVTPSLREQVLQALLQRPQTDQELSRLMGRPDNTIRPRRIELVKAGLVTEFGKRRTASGRLAVVWGVVDHTYGEPDATWESL